MLRTGSSLGGMRSALLHDFESEIAIAELQVLGILGKHLTGPWMKRFYTLSTEEINHVDGILVVKRVVEELKKMTNDPSTIKF